MKEGQIILTHLPQSHWKIKLRPVLLLKQFPVYKDFLACGIYTQLHQLIKNFDELIDEDDKDFSQTGLRQSSITRLNFLAVISNRKLAGSIGNINFDLHKVLLNRLAFFLVN